MKAIAVMLAGVHTHTHTSISTRNNLIEKINTKKVSVINYGIKKRYM